VYLLIYIHAYIHYIHTHINTHVYICNTKHVYGATCFSLKRTSSDLILIDARNINMDVCGEKCLENVDPLTENVQRRKQLGLNKM